MLADRIPEIQAALAEADLDGWFFSCFQHNDPVSLDLLGLADGHITRRCYYLVPRQGEPKKLAHALEPAKLDHLPGGKTIYLTWQEHAERFAAFVRGMSRLAAQYSPNNTLPNVSRLDAGTAELLRAEGCELVSSADLVQTFAAVWTEEQLASHRRANTALHEIVLAAFGTVSDALRAERAIDEYQVQRTILDMFEQRGLWSDTPPIVGVNANAADPHYQPGPDLSAPIRKGDFLLIDLFAKEKPTESIFGDITWCGVCAPTPKDRHQEIWGHVAAARDAAWALIRDRFPQTPICGWEVDDAARQTIRDAGYAEYFIHRTGHSIGTSTHGQGANMDNLETHDTRRLLPMTGFSIEPGIYLPGDFGVRSEINVALTHRAAEITGGEPQRELLRLLP